MGTIHKRTDASGPVWNWDGVEVQAYDTGAEVEPTKQVLIGPQDGAPNFVLRYFMIPPHSKSNLDNHEHDHGVMIMNGRACVQLGDQFEEIGPGDIVYVESWETHQFTNLTDEPLTFLCIIPPKTGDMCLVPVPAQKEADE